MIMRTKIWMFFVILAVAFTASARWFIVAIPGGAGVQLQSSSTLNIAAATLAADPQDPNSIVVTIRLRMQ